MKAKQTGFTLIELMFTIMVLAVLLGIGVPNFREFVRNSRMTAAANDLLGDLSLARSEAVKRRAQVTVCGTTGGSEPSCSTAGTAFSAWVVFVDTNGDDEYQKGTDELLRQHDVIGHGIEGTGDSLYVSYRHNGFITPGSATEVLFCDPRKNAKTVGNLPAARAVEIGPAGRASVTRPSTGC